MYKPTGTCVCALEREKDEWVDYSLQLSSRLKIVYTLPEETNFKDLMKEGEWFC